MKIKISTFIKNLYNIDSIEKLYQTNNRLWVTTLVAVCLILMGGQLQSKAITVCAVISMWIAISFMIATIEAMTSMVRYIAARSWKAWILLGFRVFIALVFIMIAIYSSLDVFRDNPSLFSKH